MYAQQKYYSSKYLWIPNKINMTNCLINSLDPMPMYGQNPYQAPPAPPAYFNNQPFPQGNGYPYQPHPQGNYGYQQSPQYPYSSQQHYHGPPSQNFH